MRIFVLLAAGLLASCGADGAPERPEPGLRVSGEVGIGVELN